MPEVIARFLLVFSGLFVIVDPVGTIPLMLGLTGEKSPAAIRRIVLRACFFAAGLLVFFALVGSVTLSLLRINLDAFRVAGGVLLFLTALDMMKGGVPKSETHKPGSGDISFVPLGMPSLAGPGAITSVIVFSTDHTSEHVLQSIVLISAILCVIALSFLILRAGVMAQRLFGLNGLMVLSRIMGLFLAALSVQFVLEGVLRLSRLIHPW